MHAAVLGGGGTVGALVLEELARRNHTTEVIASAPGDAFFLEREFARARPQVVIATTGPAEAVAAGVVPAAVAAGVPVVDASFAQAHVRHLHDAWTEPAAMAGIAIVPAAGLAFLLGDLLGGVAAAAAPGTEEVHVAYALPRRLDLWQGWTRGARRELAAALGHGAVARRDGRLVDEEAGEARRLAWFPRPVGPHHAAGIPGAEAVSLPRHVAGLRTVRTYMAVPSLVAEVLQAAAGSFRRERGWAVRLVERMPRPDAERRAELRWACVAEAPGEGGTARAWAYGTDPYRFAAAALVLTAERVAADGDRPRGVLAPGQLGDPAELLDELTLRTGARWVLSRP